MNESAKIISFTNCNDKMLINWMIFIYLFDWVCVNLLIVLCINNWTWDIWRLIFSIQIDYNKQKYLELFAHGSSLFFKDNLSKSYAHSRELSSFLLLWGLFPSLSMSFSSSH
jgi:hypothetical protein